MWSARRFLLYGDLHVDLRIATIFCYTPSNMNVLYSVGRAGADNCRQFVARLSTPTDSCGRVRRTIAHTHQDFCSSNSLRSVMT